MASSSGCAGRSDVGTGWRRFLPRSGSFGLRERIVSRDLGPCIQHLTLIAVLADLRVDPGIDFQLSVYSRVRFLPVRGSIDGDDERDVSDPFLDSTFENVKETPLDGGESSPSVSTTITRIS